MRICEVIATGRIIGTQTDCNKGECVLIPNAVNAGFDAADVRVLTIPDTEYEERMASQNDADISYIEKRKERYKAEADELFFQEQRGEVPAGTWEAKVNEIKLAIPKTV